MRTGLAVLFLLCCALEAPAQSERVRELFRAHDWENAQQLARELWKAAEAEEGARSPEAAAALNLLVEGYRRGHAVQDPTHLELAERAVQLNESLHGDESLEAAEALFNLAVFRRLRNEQDEAEALQRRALEIRVAELGDADPLVADCHAELGSVRYAVGDFDGALEGYRRSLQIRRAARGDDSLEVSTSLRLVGTVHVRLGQDEVGLEHLEESLDIAERALGPEHPSLGPTLSWIGAVERRMGRYQQARATFARVLEIRRASLPPDHRDIGESLTLLASVDGQLGNYEAAVVGYEEGIAIIREHASEGDPYLAQLIRGYASLLQSGGEIERALSTMDEAIAMLDPPDGEPHPDLGIALEGRAGIRRTGGDYVGSKRDCERAIELHRRVFGEDSVDVAWSEQALGITLYEMGDDVDARRVLLSALEGFESRGVTDPTALGGTLNDLGLVLTRLGEYEQAEAHVARAVEVWRDSGSRDVVLGLRNLGDVARDRGDLAMAKERYEEAIAAAEANPAAHALTLPGHYLSLAGLQREAGDLKGALASNDRAMEWIESTRATSAPRGVATRSQRAVLLSRLGRTEEAFSLALAVETESRAHAVLTIRSLPERQALRQVATRASGLDVLLHASFRGESSASQRRAAYEALLRSRSLVLDELARRARQLAAADDPVVGALLDELQHSRARLAHLLLNPPAEPGELHEQAVLRARRQKESLEADLAALGASMREERTISAAALAEALTPRTRLLSYVRYAEPEERYGAFVLSAGEDTPSIVELGPASPIDEAVRRWHESMIFTGSGAIPGASQRYRDVALRLRQLVLDPLRDALGEAETVFLVPDGSLHLLNVATLPDDGDGYLLDASRRFQLLSSERDLLEESTALGDGLLVLGGPDYDTSPASDGMVIASLRGERSSCESFTEREFASLPLARVEAEELADLWGDGAQLFTGPSAREGALKQHAAGKRALHLSTHGFVLSGRCAGGNENPLLLSGLAFAGANQRQEASPDNDDGILTAEEAASLELSGVEWVVLSACDTGTGQIADGEGVLGLRRAFEMAGAESLITSLWPVADDATARWMRFFYEARLRDGASLAESVRAAARALRDDPRTAHPYYWGAFVASGR